MFSKLPDIKFPFKLKLRSPWQNLSNVFHMPGNTHHTSYPSSSDLHVS